VLVPSVVNCLTTDVEILQERGSIHLKQMFLRKNQESVCLSAIAVLIFQV